MPPQSPSDTFLWIGPSGSTWGTASDWYDQTTGNTGTIVPGAGGTAIVNGGTGITINGTGTAATLDVTGTLNFDGGLNLGVVDLTTADASLVFTGPTSGAAVATIGTLVETGAGASFYSFDSNMTVVVDSLSTVTGTIVATDFGAIDLPDVVTMNGGTLFSGPMDATILIGGTTFYDCLGIAPGGTLIGSGSLYGQYDYVAPAGGLSGELLYGSVGVAVNGLVQSSGFTVYGILDGSGTIEVLPDGFFTAAVTNAAANNLTFNIENGATLHLSSSSDSAQTINFAGSGGIAEFYTDNYVELYNGLPLSPQDNLYDAAPITGFTQGDRLFGVVDVPGGLEAPVWTQNGGSGTLSFNEIFNTGITSIYFTLQGTYTTADFLATYVPDAVTDGTAAYDIQIDLAPATVYATSAGSGAGNSYTWVGLSGGAWGDAANWYDVTTGSIASVAPGAGDTASVVGPAGALYTVITQTGSVGPVSFSGNVALEGTVSAASVTLATSGTDLLVTNGGTVIASALSIAAGAEAFADGNYPAGAGGYIDITGGATVAAGAVLAAGDGGRVQVDSLTTEGGDGNTNSVQIASITQIYNSADTLVATPNGSAITVGTLDDAASGEVMIDPGAVFTDLSPASNQTRIAAPIVDDGTLIASNLWVNGFSGTGFATVATGGLLVTNVLATNASVGFTIEAGGNLEIEPEAQLTGGSITWEGTGDGLSISANGVYPDPFVSTPMLGFTAGDSVEIEDPGVLTASWTQSSPTGGTVSLLDPSNNLLGNFALQGNYTGDSFIVTDNSGASINIALAETGNFALSAGTPGGDSFNYTGISGGAWGDPANWTETTPSVPAIAPGANDSISVGSVGSNGLTVITGSGNAGTWTLNGNAVAVAGDFNVGTLAAPTDTSAIYELFIDAGGTLNVGSVSFGNPATFAFVDYDPSIIVDGPGALLNVTGALTGDSLFGAEAFVANSGGIVVENGATASIANPSFSVLLTGDPDLGSGTFPLALDGGGTLILPTTISSSAIPIAFSGTSNVLEFDTPAATSLAVTPTITGFAVSDTIDVTFAPSVGTVTAVSETTSGVTLDLVNSGGTTVSTLALTGDYISDTFYSQELAGGTTEISLTPLCFLAGTRIATPTGETEVERLVIGDLVLTAFGEARPVTWIGNGRVLATRGRRGPATPVIVRKGALADNVPSRDLRVTKGHSLYLDDVLIPVDYLVNHRTILWDDHAQEVTIYHVELETHDVLLANGAAAESYRDDGNRWLFLNANSGWGLPPQEPCAPVLTGGPVVDAVWQRLLQRAGWRPGVPLTEDADVHLVVDGRRLDAAQQTGDTWIFYVAAPPSEVCIVSRSAAPTELGLARDSRMLGVALRRLAVRQGTRFRLIEAGDDRLADGFHAYEPDSAMRWTDGEAVIPAELYSGLVPSFEFVLHIGAMTRYLADGGIRNVA